MFLNMMNLSIRIGAKDMSVLFLGYILIFFALTIGLAKGCARLGEMK
jgi:hypothetical protein